MINKNIDNKIIYISPQIQTFDIKKSILQTKGSRDLDFLDSIFPILEELEDQGEL